MTLPRLSICALLLLASGCGGGESVEPPTSHATKLALITPPPDAAQSGVAFTVQPVVQLQDEQAAVAQAGIPITVRIASGGGSLVGATTINTAADGRASFAGIALRGTVGPHALAFESPNLISVNSGTIALTSGPAARIAAGNTNPQTAPAGSAVSLAPSVRVTDADDNPVAGVVVTFEVTSGGGAVELAASSITDANGVAGVTSWTLGTTPGPNTLSATAAGLTTAPVVFAATGLVAATIRGTITLSNDPLAVTSRTLAARATFGAPPSRKLKSLVPAKTLIPGRPAREQKYAPDELIVRFRSAPIGAPPVGAAGLGFRTTAAAVEGEIRSRMVPLLAPHAAALMGVSPTILAARVRVKDPREMARVAAALRLDPAVATVERNAMVWSTHGGVSPVSRVATGQPIESANDPFAVLQAWHYGMIDLPEAWSITTGSPSVLVAVVDDGTRFDHPAIAANLSSDGYDFVSDEIQDLPLCSGGTIDFSGDGDGYDADPTTPNGFEMPDDCLVGPTPLGGHGLIVSGIIGAVGNDGVGTSGINWAVRIRPVRVMGVFGSGLTYDVVQGILYAAGFPADDGAGGTVQAPSAARIINMSIGSPEDEAILRDAILAVTNAGVLVISVAGNDASSDPFYPGAYPEVLSTSAVGPDGILASYSSFGSTIDIAAPGGDFDDGAASFGVISTSWDFTTGAPNYVSATGTSVAAPHVAGVAALLLARDPGLTSSQLRSRLIDYAVDAGPPGPDSRYGAGILNARNSLEQNLSPPRQLRARLYSALTGAAVQTVAVAADGSYSFGVTDGSYQVFAGQDDSGDLLIGLPGRRWGAFGSAAKPTRINVEGVGTHQASFQLGLPSEREPNETISEANALPVGGYVSGVVSAPGPEGDSDVFKLLIPQAGQYTFETSAVDGACGFALEEDTVVGLFRPDETSVPLTVDFSDDIDFDAANYCSRLTANLQPGTYYLRVQGYAGGRYQVQARSGP